MNTLHSNHGNEADNAPSPADALIDAWLRQQEIQKLIREGRSRVQEVFVHPITNKILFENDSDDDDSVTVIRANELALTKEQLKIKKRIEDISKLTVPIMRMKGVLEQEQDETGLITGFLKRRKMWTLIRELQRLKEAINSTFETQLEKFLRSVFDPTVRMSEADIETAISDLRKNIDTKHQAFDEIRGVKTALHYPS
jgi:hypothetical protein